MVGMEQTAASMACEVGVRLRNKMSVEKCYLGGGVYVVPARYLRPGPPG